MRPLSRRRPIAGRRGTRHLGNGNTPFHTYIQRTRTQPFTAIHVTFSWHISLQVFCRHMFYVRHVCRYVAMRDICITVERSGPVVTGGLALTASRCA